MNEESVIAGSAGFGKGLKVTLAFGILAGVLGGMAGGFYGSFFVPGIGTLFGAFWGVPIGFVGGTVAISFGPRWFGLGGLLCGALIAWLFGPMFLDMGGVPVGIRWVLVFVPGVLAVGIGTLLSHLLQQSRPRDEELPLIGRMRRMILTTNYLALPFWYRFLLSLLALSFCAFLVWLYHRLGIILW